ncbi:MAG: Mov34/MPN/PAD-1 family protein [Candidatus Lokiarchaeota archaeon]
MEKDIKLIIDKSVLEDIMECVNSAQPNEACGLIFGDIEEIKNPSEDNDYFYKYLGKKFKCFQSDHKSPIAFLMENVEILNKIYKEFYDEYKLKLVSIFHSHPSGNYPSGIDSKNMKRLDQFSVEYAGKKLKNPFKRSVWLIMDASNNEAKAFLYHNGEIVQINLIIQKK